MAGLGVENWRLSLCFRNYTLFFSASSIKVKRGPITGRTDPETSRTRYAGPGKPAVASCHGEFRAAYAAAGHGRLTEATWARGRGWALNLAIVFLAWSADNPPLHGVGRRALAAVLADEAAR